MLCYIYLEARTVSWIVFIICCATRNVMAAPVRHRSPALDDESATETDQPVEEILGISVDRVK